MADYITSNYLGNAQPDPGSPDWLKLIAQGGMVPPDQAQVEQAGMANVPPALRADKDMPAPQKVAPVPMVQNFAPGPGIDAYLGARGQFTPVAGMGVDRSLIDQYKKAAQESLLQQKAGIDQLENYSKNFADKKTGVDWTPLAALADSMNGQFGHKTNLEKMALDTRGMTPDEKDDKLLKLQEYIQGAKQNMSKGDLAANGQILSMLHQQQMLAHADQMAKSAQDRADAFTERNNIARDNQSAAAVDKITKDSQLIAHSQRINGADRILSQMDLAKAGGIVDTQQLLNDINSEYVNLLRGSQNTALGHLERTEYGTYATELSGILQKIKNSPQSIDSPLIMDQLRKSVVDLRGMYSNMYDQRANALQRNYAHNKDATRQQTNAINMLKGQYVTPSQAPTQSKKIRVSNGKEAYDIDPEHLSDARADGFEEVR